MQRVQPGTESIASTDGAGAKQDSESASQERSQVTKFSWDVAIKFFDKTMVSRLGKAGMYFMDDGIQINDEEYLTRVTAEICREFGYELLDVLADLILPIGFGYSSLSDGMTGMVEDAFKPISKAGQRKTIVWIEDEHWNVPSNSIVEPLIMQLLLEKAEPLLIAPMKYFDKEVLSKVFKIFDTILDAEDTDPEGSSRCWQTFSMLLKFGFLLALRSTTYPLILLHFSHKFAENIDAFQMLDLAEAEGHEIKYFKNIPSSSSREGAIVNFVEKVISSIGTS